MSIWDGKTEEKASVAPRTSIWGDVSAPKLSGIDLTGGISTDIAGGTSKMAKPGTPDIVGSIVDSHLGGVVALVRSAAQRSTEPYKEFLKRAAKENDPNPRLKGIDGKDYGPDLHQLGINLSHLVLGFAGSTGDIGPEIERIAASKTPEEIAGSLKRIGVTDDLIPEASKLFSKIDDPKIVSKILGFDLVPKALPGTKALNGEVEVPSARVVNDVAPVSQELEPIAQEARKYKSVEEFKNSLVESNNNTSAIQLNNFPIKLLKNEIGNSYTLKDLEKLESGIINNTKAEGNRKVTEPISVQYNPSDGTYSFDDGLHRLAQALHNKDLTIPAHIEIIDAPKNELGGHDTFTSVLDNPELLNKFYNDVIPPSRKAPDKLPTEKVVGTAKLGDQEIQITKGGKMDIPVQQNTPENQVVEPQTTVEKPLVESNIQETTIPPVKAEDVNTVKQISEQKTSGPVKDILQTRFKHISPKTIDIFAKRMSKLKGTEIITGLLDGLKRIDAEIQAQTADGLRELAGKIPTVPFEETQYVPKQLGDLMSKEERFAYLDNLTKNIKDREGYALAQAEYDQLFARVNARAVLQFEELNIEKKMLEQLMSENPTKELLKYRDIREGGYNLEEKKTKGLDSIVEELGFKDLKDAQNELEKYLILKDRVSDIKGELKKLRPQVQMSRLLKNYLDDIPVVKDRGVLAVIDKLATANAVRGSYKDISGLEKEALDPFRIFKKFFGQSFKDVDQSILQPFQKSKGDFVDEVDKLATQIEDNVTNRFNIQRGSRDATLVREYGEGKKGWQDLINIVGEERAKELMAADAYFRGWYDKLLDEANEILAQIYPNNPEKLIPKHSNYYRHLREGSALNETLNALKNLFETPAGISPQLAGQSEFTKPRSKWLAFAQRRIGEKTDTDAIEGAMDYIASFAYLKHISPNIGKFRYLRRRLAEVAPTPGDPQEIGLGKESGINNMLVFLDNYSNKLAGKSHPLDRWISDTIPGGRQMMNVLNFTNNRVKANTILFSLTSAVAQLAHIPENVASAKLYTLPGIRRSLGSIFTPNLPIKDSNFIKEREMKSLVERFKLNWLEHPFAASSEKGKEVAKWLLEGADMLGTHLIWNSHYEQALGKGIDNPVKYADNKTRDIVAGRGIGEVPLGQQSKVFQLFAPFTLEVGNALWVYKDFFNDKDFAGLILLILGSYIFNEASEKVRGSRVVYDPLNALIEGGTMLEDEDNKKAGLAKFVGRQAGELLSNVPLGSTFLDEIPDKTVETVSNYLTDVPMTKQDIMGQGNPGRYGSGLLVWQALSDPLFRFLAPFGGVQARRSIDGVQAYVDGKVESTDGKFNFTINKNAANLVKAILFGKNATEDANKFFDERDHLFRVLDNQAQKRDQNAIDAENKFEEIQDVIKNKGKEAGKSMLLDIAKSNVDLAKQIISVAKDEKLGLNANERLIKMLGVENGERASYIFEGIKDLSKEEQKARILDYSKKKIITKQVLEQIIKLKSPPKI